MEAAKVTMGEREWKEPAQKKAVAEHALRVLGWVGLGDGEKQRGLSRSQASIATSAFTF